VPRPRVEDEDGRIAAGWDRSASAYDDVLEANRHGARRLVAALPDPPYRRVVDVGCGTGFASLEMARRAGARHLVGVDVSAQMVARYRERLGALEGVAVEAHVADVLGMPVAPGSADAVVSTMALHWLPDRRGAVRAMAAALRPGGALGVLASGRGSDHEYRDLIAALRPAVPPELVEAYERMQVDEVELEAHVRAAGLEPVDVWTERRSRHLAPERFVARKRATEAALLPDMAEGDRQRLWDRIADAVHGAAGPEGFAYTFLKAYAVARRPG
jgi:SAM-dependent methyltransferase